MAITFQQAQEMSLDDLKSAINAEARAARTPEKPVELQQLEKSFSDFVAATPDFQKSPENINVLMSRIAWTRVPTVDDLTQSHAMASYRNDYKAPQAQPETSPEKMPMEQLREAAFGAEKRSPEWSMPLADLKKEAGV